MTIDPNTSGSAGRDPILRTVPRPGDINTNGHIFGVWVFSQMDIAGGIVAAREALGPVATVAIEAKQFIAPILLQDIISVYAHVERRGRTSVAIRHDVHATHGRKICRATRTARGGQYVEITGGRTSIKKIE